MISGEDQTPKVCLNDAWLPIDMPGFTTDGWERWIIPTAVNDGDSIQLDPWPPPHPVVVMHNPGGAFRTLFRFQPGQDVLIASRMSDWRHALSPVAKLVDELDVEPDLEDMPMDPDPLTPEMREEGWKYKPLPKDLLAGFTPAGQEAAAADSLVAGRDALIEAIRGADDPIILWWINKAYHEAQATVTKAREYGSAELQYAGHVIARIGGREVDKAEAMELQIFHYVLGKMGRWVAAVTRGERVADDTPFDMGVYVRMVQYLREHGEWVD